MTPFMQLERHKEFLDVAEQAEIEREQWIDDETQRLLQHFPDTLAEFRHWRLHPDVISCCQGLNVDEPYRDFIWQLAHLQATENYNLQVLLRWEEPA